MHSMVKSSVDILKYFKYNDTTLLYPLVCLVWVKVVQVMKMEKIEEYKEIFDKYGGMMRTCQLNEEKVLYRPLQKLVDKGLVEKVRYGYYQWIDHDDLSEISTIIRLFPDAVLCMYSALRYYEYSDRIPGEWHLAVSKHSGKSRFKIDYPFVKPYYVEPSILELGLTYGDINGHEVRIYDKDRLICDCIRYRNRMDKEIFNKAIQSYVTDSGIYIPNLLEYAEILRVKKPVKELVGIWL